MLFIGNKLKSGLIAGQNDVRIFDGMHEVMVDDVLGGAQTNDHLHSRCCMNQDKLDELSALFAVGKRLGEYSK